MAPDDNRVRVVIVMVVYDNRVVIAMAAHDRPLTILGLDLHRR